MRKSKRWLSACLLTLILCLGVFCTPAMADNSTPEPTHTPQPENGVEVTVSEDGTYTVSLGDWEWTFRVEDLAEARIGTVVNVHSYLNVRTGAGTSNQIIGRIGRLVSRDGPGNHRLCLRRLPPRFGCGGKWRHDHG